jgi:glycine cleavage system H protein
MKVPTDRKYTETHEWFLIDDDTVTIGVTQYAADELTDITYVELPEVGTVLSAGGKMGEVESVKATSEILTAVSGEVIEVNAALVDHPELVNDDAFEEGWMVKLRAESTEPLTALLDAKEYESFISSAG